MHLRKINIVKPLKTLYLKVIICYNKYKDRNKNEQNILISTAPKRCKALEIMAAGKLTKLN